LQTNVANHACTTSSKILHTQHVCPHLRQSISNLDPLELHIHVLMLPSWLDIALLKSCYSPMAEDGNDFLGCDETLMNFRLKWCIFSQTSIMPVLTPRLHFRDVHENNQTTTFFHSLPYTIVYDYVYDPKKTLMHNKA